jgi:CDP-diacylglycerol--glycerol-3-phosphate 3-phosphatidyltransferase
MITLADRVTLARLVLAPIAVASYLTVPGLTGLVITGLICGLAETTDWLDGRIARARREVSDFGKLADPFCDVFYRLSMLMVMLLPPALAPYWSADQDGLLASGSVATLVGPAVYVVGDERAAAYGMMPWAPVFLMVLREIIAGALRAMTATKGLVLAARTSGKVKAWMQGVTIITPMGLPLVTWLWALATDHRELAANPAQLWQLEAAAVACWACAAISVASIIEYIHVNRSVLAQLVVRREM